MNPSLLFVTGLARGGTTLTQDFLRLHPKIALSSDAFRHLFKEMWHQKMVGSPGFVELANSRGPIFDGYFVEDHAKFLKAVREMDLSTVALPPEELEAFKVEFVARMGLSEEKLIEPMLAKLRPGSFYQILTTALKVVADGPTGGPDLEWVGMKELWMIDFIPALARAFPKAKFVIVMRDPRAIISSVLRISEGHPQYLSEPISCLRHWRKYCAYIQWLKRSALKDEVHVVRFEDLTASPSEVAADLEGFLGVEELMSHVDEQGIVAGNSSFGDLRQSIDPVAADRWKSFLPELMEQLASKLCYRELRLLGYEVEPATWPWAQLKNAYEVWSEGRLFNWKGFQGSPDAQFALEDWRESLVRAPQRPSSEDLERAFIFPEVYDLLREIE